MDNMPKPFRHDHESLMSPYHAAKLTPAEIRSLHNGHLLPTSRSSSLSTAYTRSSLRQQRTLSRHAEDAALHRRSSSSQRPTTPPAHQRRPSTQSIHIHNHVRPLVVAPPTTAMSYRGIATYRGPEITPSESLTMLHHPTQQILTNPLSAFSRPRQSITTRSDSLSSTPPRTTSWVIENRNREPSMASRTSSTHQSPMPRSHSPVSLDDDVRAMTAATATGALHAGGVDRTPLPPPQPDEQSQRAYRGDINDSDPASKQKLGWRRALTGSSEPGDDVVALRKEYRRRTLMLPASQKSCLHAIHYDDTRPGPPPSMKDSLKDDLPSTKTSVFRGASSHKPQPSGEFDQHPAVRPLVDDADDVMDETASTASHDKGKLQVAGGPTDVEDDDNAVPTYGRCSCCGRVQRPGDPNEFDPVIENENLRTNFNLEATRDSMDFRRQSTSHGSVRARYTPIIPMEVGRKIRQARIEPPPSKRMSTAQPPPVPAVVIKNKAGDVIASHSTPLAIMPRTRMDPRLVRFGSLNISREERDRLLGQAEEPALESSTAQTPVKRFGSLHGRQNSDLDTLSKQSTRQSAYQVQQSRSQRRSSQASTRIRQYDDDSDDNINGHAMGMPSQRYPRSIDPSVPLESPNMIGQLNQSASHNPTDISTFDGSLLGQNSTHAPLHVVTSFMMSTTTPPLMTDYTTADGHYEPTVDLDHVGNYSSSGPSSPVVDNRGSIGSINSADVPRYSLNHNQVPMRIQSLMRESYKAVSPQRSPSSGNLAELPPAFTFPRKSSLANLNQARKRSEDVERRAATPAVDGPVPAVPDLNAPHYASVMTSTPAGDASTRDTTPSSSQSVPLHHSFSPNSHIHDQPMVHHGALQPHTHNHNHLSDQHAPTARNTTVAVV